MSSLQRNYTNNAMVVRNTTGIFVYSRHSLAENITLIVTITILMIWIVIGNLTVMVSVIENRVLRASRSNILIGNLAMSDLLLGLIILPLSGMYDIFGYWPLGKELCFLWLITDVLLCTASIWSLLVIAVDRYTATFFPIWYRNKFQTRKIILYIATVWVVSTVTSIPPLLGFGGMTSESYDGTTNPAKCELFATLDFVLYSSAMTFIVPAIVLLILYGKIFMELRKRAQKRMRLKDRASFSSHKTEGRVCQEEDSSSSNNNESGGQEVKCRNGRSVDIGYQAEPLLKDDPNMQHLDSPKPIKQNRPLKKHDTESTVGSGTNSIKKPQGHSMKTPIRKNKMDRKEQREERATKIMLTVMLIFLICWLPFFIMYITRSVLTRVCPGCVNVPEQLQKFLTWLGYINSAINPLLYTAFNKHFRHSFKTIWCKILRDKNIRRGLRR